MRSVSMTARELLQKQAGQLAVLIKLTVHCQSIHTPLNLFFSTVLHYYWDLMWQSYKKVYFFEHRGYG